MKCLAFDVGRKLGFGLLDGKSARSGSFEVLKTWSPLGTALLTFEAKLQSLIDQYEPDVIGVARPFTRRGDTPMNLVPMYCAFGAVHQVAALNKIPVEVIQESDARLAMLGKGNMPRGSAALKKAIHLACRSRGWRACDYEASDGLCIAAAVLEKRQPGKAHQTTPLFAVPTKRRRKLT